MLMRAATVVQESFIACFILLVIAPLISRGSFPAVERTISWDTHAQTDRFADSRHITLHHVFVHICYIIIIYTLLRTRQQRSTQLLMIGRR